LHRFVRVFYLFYRMLNDTVDVNVTSWEDILSGVVTPPERVTSLPSLSTSVSYDIDPSLRFQLLLFAYTSADVSVTVHECQAIIVIIMILLVLQAFKSNVGIPLVFLLSVRKRRGSFWLVGCFSLLYLQ
jgi:hypothetical protein